MFTSDFRRQLLKILAYIFVIGLIFCIIYYCLKPDKQVITNYQRQVDSVRVVNDTLVVEIAKNRESSKKDSLYISYLESKNRVLVIDIVKIKRGRDEKIKLLNSLSNDSIVKLFTREFEWCIYE